MIHELAQVAAHAHGSGGWIHRLAIWAGLENAGGPVYSFWSGIGSDIGELTLVGLAIGLFRQHNCHVKGCFRVAKHPVEGTPYKVCRKHHPTIPDRGASVEEIHEAHQAAKDTPTIVVFRCAACGAPLRDEGPCPYCHAAHPPEAT